MQSSNVERIKERLDIVDVIGSYVSLQKAGKSYKAKSPFTNEKTPSFYVSPERQLFYCFSSGKGGDMFTFVQEIEGVDFKGAIKILAERAGIELQFENREKLDEREKLFALMEEASAYFEERLQKNTEAQTYITDRGMSKKSLSEWRIGYAPHDWRKVRQFLRKKGYSDTELLQVGLIKKAPGTDKEPYDTFRDRIMFPIADNSGRIVGFSGRILHPNDKAPKYLNSPDTTLFKKSDVLYGLHKAKTDIRRRDYAVLVEGQMDLLLSHQSGVTNTVASSGTAITQRHLERLQQLSQRIIISFDSDEAGFKAANRTAQLALGMGMEVKVALMEEGKDPADLVKESPDLWKEALRNARHIIDFYIDRLIAKNLDKRNMAKEIAVHVLPYIAQLSSDIEKSHFISRIVKETGFREEAIWTDLQKIERKGVGSVGEQKKSYNTINQESSKERLTAIYLWQKSVQEPFIDIKWLESEIVRIGGEELLSTMQGMVTEKINKTLFEIEEYYGKKDILDKDLKELLQNLEIHILKQQREALLPAIAEEKDEAKKEYQAISLRINKLE